MNTATKKKETSFFANTLQYVKPFIPFIPQVRSPARGTSLKEKFIWTTIAVLVYLLASQIPLFGIINTGSKDPLGWMRMMMASNRGSLMDLGISPVVTSSMVAQFLLGIGFIQPNFSIKEDKILVDALQKLIALIMTVGQSIVQIYSGYYGAPKEIGFCYCAILFIQLIVSGIIVILLDELLQKGYGLGNGVNLFIVTNVCERLIWNAFSPRVYFTGRGLEFEGCFIAMIHLLVARRNKLAAIYEILFRKNLPNMFSFSFTLLVFSFVVYLQTLRVEIPIVSRSHKGVASMYPINLLYTSTMPVMIQSYIVSYLSMISRFLYGLYPKNLAVKLFGVWEYHNVRGYVAVSGLCHYIFPPASFSEAVSRPIFTLMYLMVVLYTAGLLSRGWLESHDDNSESVFKRIKKQDMQLKGVRDASAVSKLNEYVPVAAFLGGVVTAFVIFICDVASTIGSGSNIFLAVSIINQYMKLLAKESARRTGKTFIE
ncbi:protein transport protein SEC61 subunit alpha [Pancytospora epiphaga]|nr:protein transport protein SEC61 subunit alpha [Pancytospora epiphaga]